MASRFSEIFPTACPDIDKGIAAVRAIAAIERVGGRHHAEDRRHPFALRNEPHVVVPLIMHGEGLYAPGHRMHRQRFELRRPGGVHAPEHLEIAPGPIEHGEARIARRNLDPVVGRSDADPLGRQFIHELEALGLDRRVGRAAIGEHHHRVGRFEDGRIRGPPVAHHGGVDARDAIQATRQQDASGPEFVIARGMAGSTRNEDDFFVGRRHGQRGHDGHQGEEQAFHWIAEQRAPQLGRRPAFVRQPRRPNDDSEKADSKKTRKKIPKTCMH
ncbi:MAG: hypothetical protein EBV83_09485 [Verrucomicrobia bacterium]|nr:hypothetical protein [Verrucomicrobiota bacterium]